MADAVANTRKYQRLDMAMASGNVTYEFDVSLLRAFTANPTVSSSKEEWIMKWIAKFGDNERNFSCSPLSGKSSSGTGGGRGYPRSA